MCTFSKVLLAITVFSWTPIVTAILPLTDRVLGVVQQRPLCPARPASPEFQRAASTEFISEIFFEPNGVTESFDNFISPDYIQHSPFLLSGCNNTLSVLLSASTNVNITILQIMFDSPYGMVHYRFQAPNSTAIAFMDLWRFNGTCIEEHWDVTETFPENATNPIALF
ncbi:uncharacterized protein LY89DRAFT_734495 [Mollisia scopiformis]|uniref:Uncharacterized protein n=1 Tax=Mollisia scopiformis TaxID=149040 RepID=A0A194X8F4_MOLSC|nr:uncharacterized protein LY89DRAFT_734495 [Mollisia scopiformis]KUJ16399.1 hypothetical protein LY89DRAFT_734495 [Mollisia scopiformis]